MGLGSLGLGSSGMGYHPQFSFANYAAWSCPSELLWNVEQMQDMNTTFATIGYAV